jgi:hypothetical protein
MTAKIGGSSSPCTKRQAISAGTLPANATITVGTTRTTMAAVMTRLRPSTSATAPVNGAVSAIAKVEAVMMVLICAAPTWNSAASDGSSACGM